MSTQPIAFMSQEEQDAIAGRTAREYAALQRSLTLIDAELEIFADDTASLLGLVNSRVRLSGQHPDAPRRTLPESISKYIDPAKLNALLEEQDRQLKRIRSLRLTLNGLGL
jgi:hypothetical protein